MDRLKGKRALITGGTSGIGLETARQFLSEGARVAVTGRNPATLDAARAALGDGVLLIPSDASDVAAQKQVAETVRQSFGALDILFVNAGVAELKPVEQWDEVAFDRTFAINLKGPFLVSRRLGPQMAERGWGRIINLGSIMSVIALPGRAAYAAAAAAVLPVDAHTTAGTPASTALEMATVIPRSLKLPVGFAPSHLR